MFYAFLILAGYLWIRLEYNMAVKEAQKKTKKERFPKRWFTDITQDQLN